MNIDAHHHLWKYSAAEYGWITPENKAIRRDFLPADLEPLMHHFDIEGTVAVQARATVEETEWLLDLADKHPLIRGVVGWVPLTEGAGVKRSLEQFAGQAETARRTPRGAGRARPALHSAPGFQRRREGAARIRAAVRHPDFRAPSAGGDRVRRPASQPDVHSRPRGQAADQG